MELVVMAAGMGSRFGGLKQIEPIDEEGNFIIDYSIYDAIKCGFDKIIFIIKKENYDIFKNTIGKRLEKHIKTEYAFQEIPKTILNRTKPLGTGHAVLSAKPNITSNFAVINADDFYGYDAISKMAEFLKHNKQENKYALVGYQAINTINKNNSVKRGICKIQNNHLIEITESLIERENNNLFATSIENNKGKQIIQDNQTVSMNLFGFTPKFLNLLNEEFNEFLIKNKNNLDSCEFFLPTVVSNLINKQMAQVLVLNTSSIWHGMTYKEDKQIVVNHLKFLKEKKYYPENLWK